MDQLLEIARVLREPVGNFLMANPDAYYDMIPNVISIQEILKLSQQIHEHAKRGEGWSILGYSGHLTICISWNQNSGAYKK